MDKLVIVLIVIALIVAGPLLTIWSFNTLFPMVAIPYNFFTWLSVIILGGFFKANVSIKK